jgi:hypothetical protein
LQVFFSDKFAEAPSATPLDNSSSGDQIDGMNHEGDVQMANPNDLKPQEERRKRVAFVSVAEPKILSSDSGLVGSNKRPKLDAAITGLPENLFDDLELQGIRESSIF